MTIYLAFSVVYPTNINFVTSSYYFPVRLNLQYTNTWKLLRHELCYHYWDRHYRISRHLPTHCYWNHFVCFFLVRLKVLLFCVESLQASSFRFWGLSLETKMSASISKHLYEVNLLMPYLFLYLSCCLSQTLFQIAMFASINNIFLNNI